MTASAKPLERYRLYIDESGDHTFNLLDDPSHRYLALLGVWFRQSDYLTFADNLEQFKRSVFGHRPDKPVILHRSEIINRKGPFGLLCKRENKEKFDLGLLELIRQAQFKMVCVIIDKQKHSEKAISPFHPYHYCLAAMLDRYSGWLVYKNTVGDVMAESRGREEDLQLKQAYRRVYESGTLMFDHEHHQKALTSHDIKLQAKVANIAGLQLADILAYPIKQSFLIEKGLILEKGDIFGKQICKAAWDKFNVHAQNGQVDGYGQVWL
jgi:hypothetical protein